MAIEYPPGVHAIKGNAASYMPRYIITVKTAAHREARDPLHKRFTNRFLCGYSQQFRLRSDRDNEPCDKKITQPNDFWQMVALCSRARQTVWIVGHNILQDFILLGGAEKFETGQLVAEWPRSARNKFIDGFPGVERTPMVVIESPPTIIGCRYVDTDGRIVFVDILNWLNASMREIAWNANVGFGDAPEPDKPFDHHEKYCELSAKVLMSAFRKLIQYNRDHDLGVFRYTAASQAMSMFRHKRMTQKIYPHDQPEIKFLERKACFGGRSEVFYRSKIYETVYQLDVCSMYPTIMGQHVFPYTLNCFERRNAYRGDIPDYPPIEMVAEVCLNTERAIYPFRVANHTIYPTGLFCTTLAGPELQEAAMSGHIKGVRNWARYRVSNLFGKFADEILEMRKSARESGNVLYDKFAKAIGNSLFGKFAQMTPKWEFNRDETCLRPWSKWIKQSLVTGKIREFRSFGWEVQESIGRQEKNGNFPAISAWTVAYGRLLMNHYRYLAGPNQTYYQGVDSLIVSQQGMDRLNAAGAIRNREPGFLKLERTAEFCDIRGIADYTIGDHEIIAGKPGICLESEFGMFHHQRYLAKDNLFNGVATDEIQDKTDTWHRVQAFAKGTELANHWIEPFRLSTDTNGSILEDNPDTLANVASPITK